jgi:hypothetical protein
MVRTRRTARKSTGRLPTGQLAPRDAHHKTSKRDSPNATKIKEKQEQNYPGFEFKPRQVNDSSQTNQVTVHLVSQAQSGNARSVPQQSWLNKCETSLTPWVASFSNILMSRTPCRKATMTDAAEIQGGPVRIIG